MRIQDFQDAMGKAPHEEEAADNEEGNEIVMPFVSEDGLLHHDSLQITYYPLQPGQDSHRHLRQASSMPAHRPEHCNDQSSAAHSPPVLSHH